MCGIGWDVHRNRPTEPWKLELEYWSTWTVWCLPLWRIVDERSSGVSKHVLFNVSWNGYLPSSHLCTSMDSWPCCFIHHLEDLSVYSKGFGLVPFKRDNILQTSHWWTLGFSLTTNAAFHLSRKPVARVHLVEQSGTYDLENEDGCTHSSW